MSIYKMTRYWRFFNSQERGVGEAGWERSRRPIGWTEKAPHPVSSHAPFIDTKSSYWTALSPFLDHAGRDHSQVLPVTPRMRFLHQTGRVHVAAGGGGRTWRYAKRAAQLRERFQSRHWLRTRPERSSLAGCGAERPDGGRVRRDPGRRKAAWQQTRTLRDVGDVAEAKKVVPILPDIDSDHSRMQQPTQWCHPRARCGFISYRNFRQLAKISSAERVEQK